MNDFEYDMNVNICEWFEDGNRINSSYSSIEINGIEKLINFHYNLNRMRIYV